MTDETILDEMRTLPDFDCFPLPITYHEKHKIPFPAIITPKEFYESEYTIRNAVAKKDAYFVQDKSGGEIYPIQPFEEVKIEVKTFEYKDGTNPKILKGLVAVSDEPLDCLPPEEIETIKKEMVEIST